MAAADSRFFPIAARTLEDAARERALEDVVFFLEDVDVSVDRGRPQRERGDVVPEELLHGSLGQQVAAQPQLWVFEDVFQPAVEDLDGLPRAFVEPFAELHQHSQDLDVGLLRSDPALDEVVHLLVDRVGGVEDDEAVSRQIAEADLLSLCVEQLEGPQLVAGRQLFLELVHLHFPDRVVLFSDEVGDVLQEVLPL